MVLREKRDLPSFGDVDTGRRHFYFKNLNAFSLTQALFVIAFLTQSNRQRRDKIALGLISCK